ncbi:MAG: hypothetical protein JKY56_13005 [Kofleriaceae bacterium]|nr:hypothetical protein [Kofleriaceae bacterium]
MQALAISGDKEVLLYLMDLVEHPRGDNTLPERVIDALYFAFVEPTGIKPVDGGFLKPISDRVSLLLYDTSLSSTARNDSTALLVALGPPDCIPYFTKMIGFAEDPTKYRWMGVQKGIRCAKLQGMQAIIEALDPETGYERGLLDKYLWDEILKLGELPKVASAAEQLLKSDSWVARVTGIEVLARVGDSSNIDSIKALSGDKARLKNWWGDQAKLPKGERKPIPTIGELAANVAQKLASGTKAK